MPATTPSEKDLTDSTLAAIEESPQRFREAHELTAAERAKEDGEAAPRNLDPLSAVSTANAAMPTIRSLREEIARTIATFDLMQFDRLQLYIWALQYAHVLHTAATRPTEPVPEMAARAAKLRDTLLPDLTALAKRGVIDPKRLQQLRGGPSFRNTAFDLQVIVAILRDNWGAIAGKTMITELEIAEAEALGADLTDAVDGRDQVSPEAAAATEDRARALALFYRAYDEVRRAAIYLRWHEGDADELVPSLYAGRGGRGKPDRSEEAGVKEPVKPSPAPVAPVGGGAHPVAPVAPVIPGQPGGSPFIG